MSQNRSELGAFLAYSVASRQDLENVEKEIMLPLDSAQRHFLERHELINDAVGTGGVESL